MGWDMLVTSDHDEGHEGNWRGKWEYIKSYFIVQIYKILKIKEKLERIEPDMRYTSCIGWKLRHRLVTGQQAKIERPTIQP